MEKETAKTSFDSLSAENKNTVVSTINEIYSKYIFYNFPVDVPYFVYSTFKNIFDGYFTEKEITDFLNVKTSEEFSIQIVWFFSEFINRAQEGK